MTKLVHEENPELHHYTDAVGLQGIIESQQLRATNISYLNDAEEQIGFFDRRFLNILEDPVRTAITEIASTESGRGHLEAVGGIEKAVESLKHDLHTSFRSTTLKLNNPYVASFCKPSLNTPSNDGLLSQWRGYGMDGGYAIVFETDPLNQLLKEESRLFNYQFLFWGDVHYFDQSAKQNAALPEIVELEATLQKSIHRFILEQNPDAFDPAHLAVAMLSCFHKHGGFQEETELRIVGGLSSSELLKMAEDGGEKRPQKPIHFLPKNGVLVPHIKLFGHESSGKFTRLPISKVIVGPHPNKLKRQKAVETLFEQQEIDAQVVVSDIPYLGR